jgi:hypothetical protein
MLRFKPYLSRLNGLTYQTKYYAVGNVSEFIISKNNWKWTAHEYQFGAESDYKEFYKLKDAMTWANTQNDYLDL